jgi:lipopolysaccharide/colanic/teichoic acid biosynthesis glycosyltransferase
MTCSIHLVSDHKEDRRKGQVMHKLNLFIKRAFDIASSGFLALLLTPLWIVVSIWIKIDSKGPVFFKQGRRTKNGRVFSMLKFRSMVVNAESMGAGLFNYENDPRVTKAGRFLRNSSIDELPQLFNILKGDMSVVGPRPCVTYELGDFDTLNKRYKKRFEVKAGLTGLAQVKGRNDISWDEKVGYDNQYVDEFKSIGILIDLKILFWSVIKVFKKENIYENKADNSMTDAEAAEFEEEEIIRIAHLPD